jgi:hypothetical protein
MGVFIGRKKELSKLEDIYENENVKTCMLSGRRRIGKSTLIGQFANNKRSIIVRFVKGSESGNVRIINDALSDFTGSKVTTDNLHDALKAIAEVCSQSKTLVAFDEVPYLLKDNDAAASEMQHMIDTIKTKTDSMVIICGSSISFMLDLVMNTKNPLYGRFAFTIELRPLSIEETRGFHPSVSDIDLLRLYLILGGIPAYHEIIGDRSFEQAVNGYLMDPNGMFSTETPYDIMQEMGGMSDDAFKVLGSIASGEDSYSQIRMSTGLNDNALSKCLDRLQRIGVVEKRHSVPVRLKTQLYRISDSVTSFYFRIVQKYSLTASGSDNIYRTIRPMVCTHLGKEFEGFCRDLVKDRYPCEEVGSWWGSVTVVTSDDEVQTEKADIDVSAIMVDGHLKVTMFGECKFKRGPVDFSLLNVLEQRVRSVKGGYGCVYALFSPTGFKDDLVEYAQDNGILLFGMDELIGRKEVPKVFRSFGGVGSQ